MFEVLADTEQPVARLPAHVAYAGSDPTVARAAAALREVGVGAAPATPVRLDEARDLFSAIRASDHHELLIAPLATCEIPPAGGAAVPLQDLGPCQAITLLDVPSVSIAGVQLVGPRGRTRTCLAPRLRSSRSTVETDGAP